MARLAGIELPDNKRVDYSLTILYGIGWKKSEEILKSTGVNAAKRMKELTDEELIKLNKALEGFTVEGDLKREVRQNIQRLRDINSYRGIRHARGLPVRGQRTKTNGRTKKGKKKTVGAFKKEALAKMTAAKPTKK